MRTERISSEEKCVLLLNSVDMANSYQAELEESSRSLPERCGDGHRQRQ